MESRKDKVYGLLNFEWRRVPDIRDSYKNKFRKEIALGSLYATLDALEDEGLVESRQGDPSPERGGLRPKFYRKSVGGLKKRIESERQNKTDNESVPGLAVS